MTKLNKQASALKSLLLSVFLSVECWNSNGSVARTIHSDTQPKGGGFLFFTMGIPLAEGVESNSCLTK